MHSLRHGYVTALAKAGVPLKTMMTLARHSDPKLTLNVYSHLTVHDTAAALDALPDLTSPERAPEALAATGTDPAPARISDDLSLHFPYGGDRQGRDQSAGGDSGESAPSAEACHKPLEMEGLDGPCRNLA